MTDRISSNFEKLSGYVVLRYVPKISIFLNKFLQKFIFNEIYFLEISRRLTYNTFTRGISRLQH